MLFIHILPFHEYEGQVKLMVLYIVQDKNYLKHLFCPFFVVLRQQDEHTLWADICKTSTIISAAK
jgi:hypothetical protein